MATAATATKKQPPKVKKAKASIKKHKKPAVRAEHPPDLSPPPSNP